MSHLVHDEDHDPGRGNRVGVVTWWRGWDLNPRFPANEAGENNRTSLPR